MLTTHRKLQIARVLSIGLRGTRRLLGQGDTVRVRRGGLYWQLDLKEGIDLAIYLNAYQRIGKHLKETVLRPGLTVIDIGANVGAFTLPLASAVGPQGTVIAIEATRFAFEKLQANLSLNPAIASHVLTVQVMLGDTDQPSEVDGIYSSWRLDDAGPADRHPEHGGRKMSVAGAQWATLDSLLTRDPALSAHANRADFVKLDVDGNELAVLRGARRFLESRRPSLLIEIAPYVQNESLGRFEKLLAEIRRLDYRLENAETGKPVCCDAKTLTGMIPHGAGIDVLCRAT